MAYGLIYKFIFESMNGSETKIEVLKNGYSGSAIQRPLGAAPVLRQQFSGCVAGSSLAFTPECLVDGEFSQFYTTDAKEFRVDLYRNSVQIWSGFIVPELYSEPDIAPPYDVSITAADGLGELKRYDFTPLGKVTLQALFINLMSYTGQSLPVHFISQLNYSGVSAPAFFADTYIDLDYKAGESCYDVLQYLLATFHARICYYAGAWLIARENDITFTNGKPAYINESGQAASYDGGLMEITAMGSGGLWPVDFTSSSVDPALRSIEVEAPWNLYSGLVNSGMATDTGWTKSSSSVSFITGGGYRLFPETSISQSITQLMGKPLLLTFDAATYIFYRNNVQQYSTAQVEVTFVEGGRTWYLVEDDSGALVWSNTFKIVSYRIENAYGKANAIENQLSIPVFEDGNGDPVTGVLSVKIKAALNQGLNIYGAWLTVAAEKGYKDLLQLNNGARGAADSVTIAVGYETSDLDQYKAFYGGILLTGANALVTSLSTGNFSNLDFLSLISRDYARSVALPRLRTDGTLNTPSALSLRPLLVDYRGTKRWVETFEWNLLNDDFNFSALSIPSAAITVSDEVITASGSAGGSADKTIGRLAPGSGEEGQDGITIMLSNYAHVFEADSDGYATGGTDTVYVKAFRGGTAVATDVGTITGAETGLSVTKVSNNTTSTSLWISASSSLHQQGNLTIPITADGVSVTLRYGWSLALKGKDGDPGTPGAPGPSVMYLFRGEWDPDDYYYGTVNRRDIVKYDNYYYISKSTAGEIHSATAPNTSPYWEAFGASYSSVATGFLFSEEAVLKDAIVEILRTQSSGQGQITAQGNALTMLDSSGNVRLKISGDDITTVGSTQTLNVPTTTGSSYTITDDKANAGYNFVATGTIGTISVASAGNAFSIPDISVRNYIRNGTVTQASIITRATLAILVDGVEVASGMSGWMQHGVGSTNVYNGFSIPNTTTTLAVGTRTISYKLTIEVRPEDGYTSSNGISIAAYVYQSATLTLSYPQQITEFGPNGLRLQLGNGELFQCVKNNGASLLQMQVGNYGVEVTSSGLRLRIAGTWYTAGTATISGNTVLKLT